MEEADTRPFAMSLLDSTPFARDLTRLLAGWVAAIVFVQAMAAALGMVQGPRHLHVRAEVAVVRTAVFAHAPGHDESRPHTHVDEHHDHGGWARHVHLSPTDGGTLLGDDAQDLGAAASLVLAAMVAMGPVCARVLAADAGHVMHPSRAWSCTTRTASLPERPPRA
jgi:hypothetical protein